MNAGIETARSVGYGALLGSGLAGAAALYLPDLFGAGVELRDVMLIGGCVGGAAHQLIDLVVLHGLFRPLARGATYYGRVLQICALRRGGILGDDHAADLLRELSTSYFLDVRRRGGGLLGLSQGDPPAPVGPRGPGELEDTKGSTE